MSAKYYLWRAGRACPTCGHDPVDDNVQIGHSTGGWVFLWRGWRDESRRPSEGWLETPTDWFAFLAEEVENGGRIVDEYDRARTLGWFIRFVAAKRVPVDGRPPRKHSDLDTRIVHVGGDDFAFYEIG